MYKKTLNTKIDPGTYAGRLILASLLSAIALGTSLLKLPFSCDTPLSFFQALFTSVSATCVTGLSIIPFHKLTVFGKLIILALIQLGGLGFITFSFFLTWQFSGDLGVAEKHMASEILNFERIGRMRQFLSAIIALTFLIELIGAALLLPKMLNFFNVPTAIFYSIFYSISAFCNAGITPNAGGLEIFNQDISISCILAILTFIGGIGFPVIYELLEYAGTKLNIAKSDKLTANPRLSLHLKVVTLTSTVLIVAGAVLTWLCQGDLLFKDNSLLTGIVGIFFHSISLRSAGFHIQAISQFTRATLFISCFFMLVGASPGSTGGGLKTSTFAVVMASILATIRRRAQTIILGKAIPTSQIIKSFTIMCIGIASVFVTTTLLLIFCPKFDFFSLLFEAVSAVSTTGMSTGITPNLPVAGQLVLMIAMIAGRMGSLTFIFAFRSRKSKTTYKLPEEKIFIG